MLLKRIYEEQLLEYQCDPTAADKLLEVGEAPRDKRLSPGELAAWTLAASTLLNLDETLTRG